MGILTERALYADGHITLHTDTAQEGIICRWAHYPPYRHRRVLYIQRGWLDILYKGCAVGIEGNDWGVSSYEGHSGRRTMR